MATADLRPGNGAAPSFALTGRIVTVTGTADAQAVVVRDGLIDAVGGSELAEQARAAGLPVHDVGDRLVLPGFVDPHIHLQHVSLGRVVDIGRVDQCVALSDPPQDTGAGTRQDSGDQIRVAGTPDEMWSERDGAKRRAVRANSPLR